MKKRRPIIDDLRQEGTQMTQTNRVKELLGGNGENPKPDKARNFLNNEKAVLLKAITRTEQSLEEFTANAQAKINQEQANIQAYKAKIAEIDAVLGTLGE